MKGTPTFELRREPGRLRIVRVGVEYPPDVTPDAPLPGEGAPAILEAFLHGGTLRTDATHRGFDLDAPHPDAQVWLVYRDQAGRTQRAQVWRDHLGFPEVYDPDPIPWDTIPVVKGDVKAWP